MIVCSGRRQRPWEADSSTPLTKQSACWSDHLRMTTTVQDSLVRLRQPLSSLQELEDLLVAPLLSLKLLDSCPATAARLDKPPNARQLATLQSTILAHVCPAWENQTPLIDSYFIPFRADMMGNSNNSDLILSALNILTTTPLSPFAIRLLDKLITSYSLDIFWDVCHVSSTQDELKWNSVVRSWMSIPGKVANALLRDKPEHNAAIPRRLQFV